MRPEPGAKIGDYEVLGQLGAGGMGRVYKVRHELSDRLEAMKVLLPDLEGQADLANRFLREIKVQAGLDHPNIAKLYTASRIDNQLLMFMELVEGIGLDERLRQGPIPTGDAVDYIAQVLNALDYAHQRGVIHRDIKPANMMLTANGRIKLLDFGIAKAAAESRLTMTGTTLGSLYYMSPEQIQGGQVDARSDLYAVGVSLYELATGKKPFDDESQFAIMSAHIMRAPVPPIQINRALPEEVNDEILKALSKDPAARYQTAGEFLDALSSVQSYTPPSVAPPTTRPPVPRAPGTRLPAATMRTLPTAPIPVPPRAREVPTATMAQANAVAPAVAPMPASLEPAPGGSRRFLWAGIGCAAALLAIVGFIQFGPKRQAGVKEPAPAAPVTQPPVASPVQKRAPGAGVAPGSTEKARPPAERVQGENKKPAREPEPPPSRPAQTAPAQPAATAPGDNSVPGMVNQNRVDVAQLRDAYNKLVQRALAVRSQVQGSSHPDLFDMFNAMNRSLKDANAALDGGEPDKARAALAKGLEQLNLLEAALAK